VVRALELLGQEQPFVLQVSPRRTGHERLHFQQDGVFYITIYFIFGFFLRKSQANLTMYGIIGSDKGDSRYARRTGADPPQSQTALQVKWIPMAYSSFLDPFF
jgi:hypothetical protein